MNVALTDDVALARTLIAKGASVNGPWRYRLTALFYAAAATPLGPPEKRVKGSTEIVKMLLDAGDDFNAGK